MLTERVLTPRVLLAAALAALLLYASPLAPLWYDEIYTLDVFVPQGPAGFLSDYRVPNNHLFYTLLLWVWQALVGEDLLRLRALGILLTACALPALFVAGRAIASARAGALAALLLGSSQIVGNFAAQIRGYGLSIALVSICLAGAAVWWQSGLRDRRALGVYAASGALAVWTLPSNLIVVGMVALWTLLLERPWRQPGVLVRLGLLALPLLGLLGYLPVHAQLAAWAGMKVWSPYSDFLAVLARDIVLADFAWLLPVAVLLALRARDWSTPRAAWLLLATCAIALLAPLVGPVPWPRNYVPMLALLALAGGLLLDGLAKHLRGGLPVVLAGLVATLLARPLLAPTANVDAAATAGAFGELMSPYYLRGDYQPRSALLPLLAERNPPLSVVLSRFTTFLEMESQFFALADTHNVCQMDTAPNTEELRIRCIPPLTTEQRPERVIVVARSDEDARLLKANFGRVVPAFADLPLHALPVSGNYHRIWIAGPR